MDYQKLSLGIDIGSVTVKIAILDEKQNILHTKYVVHQSRPYQALLSILKEIQPYFSTDEQYCLSVTGSGRENIAACLEALNVNEIVAHAEATAFFYPHIRSIIEIGGQDSKYIRIRAKEQAQGVTIITQKMNDLCAAGTGAFIEQQAERLHIPLDMFGQIALRSNHPRFVAGRCAVFAKTDIIHLLQEGIKKEDIAAGICDAVVRNYIAQFAKGKKIETPIALQGGLAANQGIIDSFYRALQIGPEDLLIPKDFKVMGAIGAALLGNREKSRETHSVHTLISMLSACLEKRNSHASKTKRLKPLKRNIQRIDAFDTNECRKDSEVFIGVDIGSTSTCIAVINTQKELVASVYTLNSGSVIDSVNKAFAVLHQNYGEKLSSIKVMGAGVTGSGRNLIGRYIGADIIKDEISAQFESAITFMPDVDTVFEIGGQDSKYLNIKQQRLVSFEMNKVCSAGTGSFIQEQAERLDVGVEDLAAHAFKSMNPLDLGSRCSVFMESDLIDYQQRGYGSDDLIAGVSYAIVNNYLEKVVAGNHIGTKIMLLGGVACNDGVVAAFQEVLGKPIIVPKHNEISAALGIALLVQKGKQEEVFTHSSFRGFDLGKINYEHETFQCVDCTNACRINKILVADETYYCGGACGKFEKTTGAKKQPDFFRKREELLLSGYTDVYDAAAPTIGIPRVHLFYEYFPLWREFWQSLGFQIVISDCTSDSIIKDGLEKTAIDNCFATKVVYGHIQNLIEKKITKIFYPSIIEFQPLVKDFERNYACPHVQSVPFLTRSIEGACEMLTPVFVREKGDRQWKAILSSFARELGKEQRCIDDAIRKAEEAQEKFISAREAMVTDYLQKHNVEARSFFIIVGKVYNVCDPGLNLNIAKKLLGSNIIPVPFDCLPLSRQPLPVNYCDMVWECGQSLIRAAKIINENASFFPVFITNFGCGPDSFITKYLDKIFSNKSFLKIEVDEHTSATGVETRLEAFINSLSPQQATSFLEVTKKFVPFTPKKEYRHLKKLLYIPQGFDSYRAIGAAFESIGIRTKLLPPHDDVTLQYGRQFTSGRECLPYIMHVGDIVRMTRDPEFDPQNSAVYMPASDLACRVSLFPTSMNFVLQELGFSDVPIIAPRISMDKDEMLKLFGIKFIRNLFRGLITVEYFGRLQTQMRPFEKQPGSTDEVYDHVLADICEALKNGNFNAALKKGIQKFTNIETDKDLHKPVIGLIGDDYTRGNSFANNNIIKEIESLGGVVRNVPIWSSFGEFQMGEIIQRSFKREKYIEFIFNQIKSWLGAKDMEHIRSQFKEVLECFPDPAYEEIIDISTQYVDRKTEPLVLIAIAHVVHLLSHGVHGLINIVGFQCMIHSIVIATLPAVIKKHDEYLPHLTLGFDFQKKVHQKNRLEAFMYQVNQYMNQIKN